MTFQQLDVMQQFSSRGRCCSLLLFNLLKNNASNCQS